MDQLSQIEQKGAELQRLLNQLDRETERDQVGLSLRIALGLARYKARQRHKAKDRTAENDKPKK